MNKFNQALVSCLLITAVLLGLRLMRLANSIEQSITTASDRLAVTATQVDATLRHAEALLASLRATAEAVRRSSVSQLGYYEAVGRRSSLLLAEATLLIRHADRDLRQLLRTTNQFLAHSQLRMDQLGAQLELSARSADAAFQSAAHLSARAQERLQSPAVSATLENLAAASDHLAASAAASAEVLHSLRAIVAPTRKGFWRRLLEAFIPRPSPPPRDLPPAE